jgi:hypothetical protein
MTTETAVFYDDPTTLGLKGAMELFETRTFDVEKLKKRASEFSQKNFLEKFEKILIHVLKEKGP